MAITMVCTVLPRGCDDSHRQHEQRKCHNGIGDATNHAIGPAAEKARGDAGEPPMANTSATYKRIKTDGDEPIARNMHRTSRCVALLSQ